MNFVCSHTRKLSVLLQKNTEKRTKTQTSTFDRHYMVKRILKTDMIAFAFWVFFFFFLWKYGRLKIRKRIGSFGKLRQTLPPGRQSVIYALLNLCVRQVKAEYADTWHTPSTVWSAACLMCSCCASCLFCFSASWIVLFRGFTPTFATKGN